MKTGLVIGREKEKSILQEAFASSKSEFVVVYGRRRVGKTFLVKNVLGDQIHFEMTGIQDGSLGDQLQNFKEKLLERSSEKWKKPKSWMEAFSMLRRYFTALNGTRKKVIFMDELPWMDTHKSNFLGMTKSRKSIFTALITTYSLANQHEHSDVVQNVITLEDLFLPD